MDDAKKHISHTQNIMKVSALGRILCSYKLVLVSESLFRSAYDMSYIPVYKKQHKSHIVCLSAGQYGIFYLGIWY